MRRRAEGPARRLVTGLLCCVVALLAAGCGGAGGDDEGTLRLGYFPNVTHATPIVGLEKGTFARALPGVRIASKEFLSGPELVTALLAGDVDAGYAGPVPVIVAASRAPRRLWIAAGAAQGGAMLVARTGAPITDLGDLRGRPVSIPAFGNTQDLTLRMMLERVSLKPAIDGGAVPMLRIRNGDLKNAIRTGVIEAAVAPEPYGTQLIAEGLARRVLGPGELLGAGRELTTVLVVSDDLVRRHPDRVAALLRANAEATREVAREPQAAVAALAQTIKNATGKTLDAEVLSQALANTTPSTDLDTGVVRELAVAAHRAGYLARRVGASDVLLSARGS